MTPAESLDERDSWILD